MVAYRLSSKAAADIEDIYEFTVVRFGLTQARDYIHALEARFENLAQNPRFGRSAEELAPGLRRSEIKAHVIFYVTDQRGVRIVRVLHAQMDAPGHL